MYISSVWFNETREESSPEGLQQRDDEESSGRDLGGVRMWGLLHFCSSLDREWVCLCFSFFVFVLSLTNSSCFFPEEVPTLCLYISVFMIRMGYLISGFFPLFPYFFIPHAQTALIYSCVVTGVFLLVFGAIKSQVMGASNLVYGIVWGVVSTLLVGGLAAGAAFGIVRALEGQE
jgi:hypothetical protein